MQLSLELEGVKRIRWLIKLRWLAVAGIWAVVGMATAGLHLELPVGPIGLTAGGIATYNALMAWVARRLEGSASGACRPWGSGRQLVHLQIGLDWLALALLIHFSGGLENPFLWYFIFHGILASILLSRRASYAHAALAVGLVTAVGLLEYFHLIPHIPLWRFLPTPLYAQRDYVVGVLAVFASALVIVVYLTGTIMATLRAREAGLAELHRVSAALISSFRLPEVLNLIASKAAEVMGSDFCSLMLLESGTQRLRVQAVYGPGCHCQGGHPLHRCEAVAYRTVSEQRTQIIRDFQGFSGQEPTFPEPCGRLAYLVSVPLVARERPIGVLNVGGALPRRIHPQEVELLELFSHLASVAIENAQLMVTSVLLPEVHHRVKNNLQDIASLLSLQQRRLQSPEAQAALRDTINRIKGLALVHDLMSHSGPGEMDLTALAQEIKTRLIQPLAAPEQTLVIEVEGEPLVLPNRLVQAAALVLNELASNALKHAFRGRERGHLCIAVGEWDGQVELRVQDDGPGLPAQVLAGRHRGLGLTIVETLVQRDLNGRLEWQNSPGATVRVTFPKAPLGPWPELGLP